MLPQTTERMTYEDRVERVPVKVCRRVPVGQPLPQSADRNSVDRRQPVRKSSAERVESNAPAPESKANPQRPQPRSKSRWQPEMRLLDAERVAHCEVPHAGDAE